LLPPRAQRIAWIVSAIAAAGFAFESSDWTFATMQLAFAVAGMGAFVALVWLTSRALGFEQMQTAPLAEPAPADPGLAAPATTRSRAPRGSKPLHSA
jgi:hypothetical protein